LRRRSLNSGRPAASRLSTPGIRSRLLGGLLAGPIFVGVTAIEVLSRDGFDLRRNGISQLSLGDRGWIQIVNFLVAGALSVAFGTGVRRLLGATRGGTWAPRFIRGYGLGLIVTGVFLVDPGAGFPPGTAAGVPALSWHGAVHAVAPPVAFACLIGASLVLARRFATQRRWGWAAYCGCTAVAAAALIFWPAGGAGSVQSAVAVLVTSAWMTAVAADLMAELSARARGSAAQ
jgi:Protein of unknown function (DUF998)